MRRAWEEFLGSGAVLPFVRPPIAQSWLRSRQLGIQPSLLTRPVERGFERLLSSQVRQLLVHASERVIDRLLDLTDGSPLSFTVTDADGLILVQRGNARLLANSEQVGVVPGTRWAELDVGTNGIGTSLASRQTMQVFATEHYCEAFHGTTCTAALVRHPLTRQPMGVFDITSGFAEPVTNIWALATQSAALIEHEMKDLLSSNDERLLKTLSAGGDDLAAYAIDLEGRHTITNRSATAILAPEDYSALWTEIRRSIDGLDDRVIPHVLKNGLSVLVRVSTVRVGDEPVGALVLLRKNRRRRPPSPALNSRSVIDEDWTPFRISAGWLAPARASLRSHEPVLILGEPGSGKSALAAALHRNSGNGRLYSVDCALLEHWADCRRAFSPTPTQSRDGTLLLERVLDLRPALQARLVGLLDSQHSPSGPRIVTTASVGNESELRSRALRQDLLDRLAVHIIRVPPLRERGDEIQDIALQVVQELTHDRGYVTQPISKEALAVLRTYNWPGNVRQLQNVLRRGLLLHAHGQIDVKALPPELVLGAAKPRFGLIEQLEGEAILRTLESTGGNVSKAAQVTGLSRATVYRRLHAYRAQSRNIPI
jgi:transcriptional regulator of acetoin/glycerol metabolism